MRMPSLKTFCAAAALATTIALPAFADDTPKLSKEVSKPLSEADKALKAKDFATALAKVKEAQAVSTHQAYDDYVINQLMAQADIGLKDYKGAEAALEAAASSTAMAAADKPNVLPTVVQLAAANRNWPAVVQYGEQLQALGPLPANLVEAMAIAYYNTGNSQKAYAIAKPAVDADQAAGKVPPQALADIVTQGQLNSHDVAGATKNLESLAGNYGDPLAWTQLIEATMIGLKMHEPDAVNFYRLRIVAGAKNSVDDYQTMAIVANDQQYPVEAEMYLDHGIAAHEITASDKAGALLATIRPKAAKDRASIAEFEKVAAARKTGDYDLKLANTYMGYQRYADAATIAQRAISKGGLKDPQEAQLVLGEALVAQGKNAEGVEALSKVNGGVSGAAAHLWIVYAQRKYGAAAVAH